MGMEQGEYIDGGGGADFTYGYGGGGDEFAVDYASQYGGVEPIDFAPYEPQWGLEQPTFEPEPASPLGGSDLFGAYFDYYSAQGYDDYAAMQMATQDVEAGSIQTITEASYLPPDVSWPSSLPMTPYVDPWSWVTAYTPIFPDLPAPLPPTVTPTIPLITQPPPQVPMPQTTSAGPAPIAPGLPPACPGGQYHPFPIGHPDQNKCIPFPAAQTGSSSSQSRSGSSGGNSGGGAQASKPPAQQPKPPTQQKPAQQQQRCSTGYYPASNGQCLPIPRCATSGTVFDQARGLCVPKGQAISPLPEASEFGELFDNLKELPWWIWLALAGLILLNKDEGGKKTTVTYRRAR